MPQPKILVVDDDRDLKEALGVWFAKQDCQVIFAANGEEGMTTLRSGEPVDLVLTDFMMPELNGMELVRLVKSSVNHFATKIVVMSSNTNPEFSRRATELGAIEYLSKVDSAKTIVEKVVKILGRLPASGRSEAPKAALPLAEIRMASESLLNLIDVIGLVEGVPAAASTAIAGAQKLALRIRDLVEQPVEKLAG